MTNISGMERPCPARREILVEQTEGADDRRIGVRQQDEADFPAPGEPRQRLHIIVADRGQRVAERRNIVDSVVPGDRLGLAVNSPIERTGKQQDQSALAGECWKVASLAMLILGRERMGDRRADLGTPLKPVLRAGRPGQQRQRQDRQQR